jgi:tRNA-(ms[2]io[6]A)-hydroxylase
LAREELRHFEQVDKLMQQHSVPYLRVKPGRYASGLRAVLRTHEPYRKLDLLLCGALIEARSCERFRLLSSHGGLPEAVQQLYTGLEASEARHFELYLKLADVQGDATGTIAARLKEIATIEAELATAPDPEFRFHSGPPQA